jgi:hypothetical protein
VNKSLALARRAHAAAAAVVAAATAEGRPPSLADLIVDPSWRHALAADLARDSFRGLETVRVRGAATAARAHAAAFPAKTAPHRVVNVHTIPDALPAPRRVVST